MKEYNLKRWIFFSFCLVAVFGATSIFYGMRSTKYEQYISASGEAAISALISSTEQMQEGLKNMQYGTDGAALSYSAAHVWSSSQTAKAALSVLPVTDAYLMQYEKLLNQTGNFALSLITSKGGGSVSDADIESLKAISASLEKISSSINNAKEKIDTGEMVLGTPVKTGGLSTLSSELGKIEKDFLSYGQLNYDGEYSQHTENLSPLYLKNMKTVSPDNTLKIVAELIGEKAENMQLLYESEGSIPVYGYGNEDLTIEITKQGGIVISVHNTRTVNDPKTSKDMASQIALQFAEELGFTGLSCRYTSQEDNILKVELISSQDSVTIYPDRITVGVALDNGKVVSFDSRSYIMSHTDRTLSLPAEIPDGAHLAIIPTRGKMEHLCFEYEEDDHLRYMCAEEGTCFAVHLFDEGEKDGLVSR